MTENKEVQTNGLAPGKINSTVELVEIKKSDSIAQIKEKLNTLFPESGYYYVFLDQKVIEGKCDNPSMLFQEKEFSLERLQEARIFNLNKELFLRRTETGDFRGRLRKDGTGESKDTIEAIQSLRKPGKGILIRAYIAYNPVGQATYEDVRFVERCEVNENASASTL